MKLNILASYFRLKIYFLLIIGIFNVEKTFSSPITESEAQQFTNFLSALSKNPSAIMELPEETRNKIVSIYHQYLNTPPEPSLVAEPEDTISIFFKEEGSLEGGKLLHDEKEEIFSNKPSIVKKIKAKHQEIKNTPFQGEGNNEADILSALGQIKAYFKNYSPSYGTGVLIDGNHVLTTASCVYTNKEAPESVIFFSYCEAEKQYTSPQGVRSISLHTKYLTSSSKEKNLYNFTILTLERAVPHPIQKLGYIKVDSLLKKQDAFKHEILYFKDFSKNLTREEVSKINNKKRSFFQYEAKTHAGSGGAPFFTRTKDNFYYLVGLHIGLSLKKENVKRSLPASTQVQQLIHLMVAKERKQAIEKTSKVKSSILKATGELVSPSAPRNEDKGKEKLQEDEGWGASLIEDSSYPQESYKRLGPKINVTAERRGKLEVSIPSDIKVGKKEHYLTERTPKIFDVTRRKNVDNFLKAAFAPNMISIMKQRFIGLDASNTDISIKGLKLIPQTFKIINLENCQSITDEALEVLQNFSELEDLTLNGCSITKKDFSPFNFSKKLKINFQEKYDPSKNSTRQEETSSQVIFNLSGSETDD
ncbi:hypothetical protein IM40_10650 (plasmid) [Candidatus Paracaedimonas acanthamoebae]|nr:hypothetical protein IM40_10650 [Candidatus Paracaedimonas acanthamoebae]